VVFVGALLAATTGILGATVVAMGLISLPAMLRNGYSRSLASGTIAASGTLGQIIPPSIVLIILADQLASAVDQAGTSREVLYKGEDVANDPVQGRSPQQIGDVQMVFQNPFDTLNPSHSVGSQLARVIRKFGVESDPIKIKQRVLELLDLVKLPRDFAKRRPRQLSGGQKQRVGIARAFAGNPAMVVADEPVSALDVSVQAAVTGLLMDIQRTYRTTLLFISHDLSLVRYLSDRVVVMYLGHIVEQGKTDDVFAPPYHPYTEALLSAVPIADTGIEKKRIILEGNLPSVMDPPKGCPFHTRCHRKIEGLCDKEVPPVVRLAEGHDIACHIPREELEKMEPVIVLAKPGLKQPEESPAAE